MGTLNELDKEIAKGNHMDTDVVRKKLHDMAAHGMPQPDYSNIRSILFSKKKKQCFLKNSGKSNGWRMRRIAVAASFVLVILTATTALASHLFNVWVMRGSEETIIADHTNQSRSFDSLKDLRLYLAGIGYITQIPNEFPSGISVESIQDTDFGLFRATVIQLERSSDNARMNFTLVYSYDNISDVKFVPIDFSRN
jgi:hypothetical protein